MSTDDQLPSPEISVEVGGDQLRIRVTVGSRSIPIGSTPEAAAKLAGELLTASVMCAPSSTRPEQPFTVEEGEFLPVVGWQTGFLNATRDPIVVVTLLGGAKLRLRFPPERVEACGRALMDAGRDEGTGQP